jgi:hypothetical protein
MGREQFLHTRAGNWSKVAMWHPLLALGRKSFELTTYTLKSESSPHKRPLGTHSTFWVRVALGKIGLAYNTSAFAEWSILLILA